MLHRVFFRLSFERWLRPLNTTASCVDSMHACFLAAPDAAQLLKKPLSADLLSARKQKYLTQSILVSQRAAATSFFHTSKAPPHQQSPASRWVSVVISRLKAKGTNIISFRQQIPRPPHTYVASKSSGKIKIISTSCR